MQANPVIRGQESKQDADRLSQAARFVTHLQLQLAELDRREQQINEQSAALIEQQLSARRADKSAAEQSLLRQRELQTQADQIAESEETLRQRVSILKQQEEEFERRLLEFNQQRDAFQQNQIEAKAELAKEQEEQRSTLAQEQQHWQAEQQQQRNQFLSEQQSLREQFASEQSLAQQSLEESRARFQAEQELARSQFQSEQEIIRSEFQDEQARVRDQFQAEQDEARKSLEEEQTKAWSELEELRKEFTEEQERHEAEITLRKAELESALLADREEWETHRDVQQNEIVSIREDLQHQRSEQERLNQQWAEHRKEEKRQHLESLEELGRERLNSLDQREREIQQREIDLQKRFRLHEDHLQRARSELTAQRAEVEWQTQQQRIWVEQVETSIRLRLGQIRKFRNLLSQREKCLADEQQLFAQHRLETEQQLIRQQANLITERDRTAKLRTEEKKNHQHQLTLLQQEIDQTTSKREELNTLATELSGLLEALRKSATSDNQSTPASHLSQVIEILAQQLLELEESRRKLTEHQQLKRTENLQLSEWIESREAWIQERETLFGTQLEELSQREQTSQSERDAWRKERMEIEQVIRELVQQLENKTSGTPLQSPINRAVA